MIPFDEKNYQNFMETEMPVWLRDTVESGKLITYDGLELQYYYCVRKPSRAAVVAVHGFCEFFGKYHELLYDLWSEGFSFFFLEQRGYGLSERENDDPETVYVRTFREYVKDLHFFMEEVVLSTLDEGTAINANLIFLSSLLLEKFEMNSISSRVNKLTE